MLALISGNLPSYCQFVTSAATIQRAAGRALPA